MSALRILIAVLVTLVWAAVYLAAVFNPNISAPPELSGVMLAVVTWLFGSEFRKGFKERARKATKAWLEEDTSDNENGAVDEPAGA